MDAYELTNVDGRAELTHIPTIVGPGFGGEAHDRSLLLAGFLRFADTFRNFFAVHRHVARSLDSYLDLRLVDA